MFLVITVKITLKTTLVVLPRENDSGFALAFGEFTPLVQQESDFYLSHEESKESEEIILTGRWQWIWCATDPELH